MAAWKRKGGLEKFEQRLIDGMSARDYSEDFARQIYQQILGFGEYGFPESHSASFALLVYVSAWLKYYEPAAFCAALLNSQPMGFYAPAQLVADARRHGVEVRPVDVTISEWDCTLEKVGSDTTFRETDPDAKARQEKSCLTLRGRCRIHAVHASMNDRNEQSARPYVGRTGGRPSARQRQLLPFRGSNCSIDDRRACPGQDDHYR